jgi:hypothetical protein
VEPSTIFLPGRLWSRPTLQNRATEFKQGTRVGTKGTRGWNPRAIGAIALGLAVAYAALSRSERPELALEIAEELR